MLSKTPYFALLYHAGRYSTTPNRTINMIPYLAFCLAMPNFTALNITPQDKCECGKTNPAPRGAEVIALTKLLIIIPYLATLHKTTPCTTILFDYEFLTLLRSASQRFGVQHQAPPNFA